MISDLPARLLSSLMPFLNLTVISQSPSNYIGLFHPLLWIELMWFVGVKRLTTAISPRQKVFYRTLTCQISPCRYLI